MDYSGATSDQNKKLNNAGAAACPISSAKLRFLLKHIASLHVVGIFGG